MNKIVISSLAQIANDLDNMRFHKFASVIDGVMERLSQTSPDQNTILKQQITDTQNKINDIPKQVEDAENQAEKSSAEAIYLNTVAKNTLQTQLETLKKQRSDGSITPEEYSQAASKINQRMNNPITGMPTPMIPSTIV